MAFILGISCFYHDSSVCLVEDGVVVYAAQEERFTRIKHDNSFPTMAIKSCLIEMKISAEDIEAVVFYEKPFLKFDRLIETYLAFAPRGFSSFARAIPEWVRDKLFQKKILSAELSKVLGDRVDWTRRLLFSEHHLSHAASAFYPSPFSHAAVLTLDGVGEWATTTIAIGSGQKLDMIREIRFPHSIGLLYSAFTYFLGFKVNSGEYKVMGLAPYGQPEYVDTILDNIIDVRDDGSFHLNMSYFSFATDFTMTNKKFGNLFGVSRRQEETELLQVHMNIAASIQKVVEIVLLRMARFISTETGQTHLCLAGGVALNCVANGILSREQIFKDVWVQPAAGDAGGALGAALAAWHLHFGKPRSLRSKKDGMQGSFIGPKFSDDVIEQELKSCRAVYRKVQEDKLLDFLIDQLIDGKAIGWMQGRMEFGPRALGSRSIIADPRSESMQKQLNLKVKYRESFRPFAPSVLSEDASDWFDLRHESPYMLMVCPVKPEKRLPTTADQQLLFGIEKLNVPRSVVPSITHVDYSARVQTVHHETNPKYYKLLKLMKEKTGVPMVINTSFNVRGEPIVCSPKDAFNCFMGTELDILVVENFLLIKKDQHASEKVDYRDQYELD